MESEASISDVLFDVRVSSALANLFGEEPSPTEGYEPPQSSEVQP